MPSRLVSWSGRIAVTMLALSVLEVCHAQQSKPTIEQIHQVWKRRQEKVASVRFDLGSEKTIHKGSVSFVANLERRRTGKMETNPPRDYLVKGATEVRISDQKLRYSYDQEQWDPNGKKLYKAHYIDVFNGELYKYLRNPASGREDHPTGGVRKAEASQSRLSFPILPLIWAFRGCNPRFFRDLDKFQLTGQTVNLGGRPCLELIRDSKDNPRREMLYLDQERDYMVIKEMILLADNPQWQLDITYAPDADVGWVPRSWEYIIRIGKEGRMSESGRMMVSSYDINPRIDDNEFDIVFPPRTRVNDRCSEFPVQYVILENGKKGREIPEAVHPTYEDLQAPPTLINRLAVIIGWSVILVLALGTWIRLRLRRRGQRIQES